MWKALRLCLALFFLFGFVIFFCDLSEQRVLATHFSWLAKIQGLSLLVGGRRLQAPDKKLS